MAPNRVTSQIWKWFKKCNDREAKCNICNKVLKTCGNTSNLRGHMEKIHGDVYNRPPDVATKRTLLDTYVIDDDEEQLLPSSTSKSISSKNDIQRPIQHKTTQPTINTVLEDINSTATVGGHRYCKITDAIVNFIVKETQPFRVVESDGFKELMREVVPFYKVPCRETIKRRIDEKYESLSLAFKTEIQSASFYTITYDIWTEMMQNKSFIGLTIHFLEGVNLSNVTVGVFELCESHTANYVKSKLTEVLVDWCISLEKVVAVVTDNDSTLNKVNRELFGEIKIIPCFAHTINLIVQKALAKLKDGSVLIGRVRDIVKFIKRRTKASDDLRKIQKDMGRKEGNMKKLILDVPTRWNSTFFMLQRFVELATIIGMVLLNQNDSPAMISSTELNIIKEINTLLQPFERVTLEMSSEKFGSVSKIIPLVSCLRDILGNVSIIESESKIIKKELQGGVEYRFNELEHGFLYSMATALDPRFKLMHFKDSLAKSKVISYLNAAININDTSITSRSESSDDSILEDQFDIWRHHKALTKKSLNNNRYAADKMQSEVQIYLSSPVTPSKADAIEIWQDLKQLFPNLYQLSIKHLPVVSTSVPSERIFSKAGQTITQERNRLTGDRLSKLLFLQSVGK